ncbi:MAG: 3-isopropylmalate dehydratase small subunit, partial [Proteobacteria bacterium]|nr:3-isopropylmalate dehydratase small subunit [Pseudomonadota bacterium]
AKERPGYALTIDLENQVVSDQEGVVASFDVDPFRKDCLVRGLDDIGLTMQHEPDITKFESSRNTSFPTTSVLA